MQRLKYLAHKEMILHIEGCPLIRRSTTTDEELGELTKTHNPEEINIDEDSDDDEQVEGGLLLLFCFCHALFISSQFWRRHKIYTIEN